MKYYIYIISFLAIIQLFISVYDLLSKKERYRGEDAIIKRIKSIY